MSTLLEKANSILAEKTTKILPENLKKNITAFGVTGTLETGAKLNIYTQLTEPTKKDGLWLKTSNTPTSIVDDENVYIGGEWNLDKMSELKDIPGQFISGSAASVGTDIYLFGGNGDGASYRKRVYKYNTLTDTYTQLSNIPYDFYNNDSVSSVGTNIYIFGGGSSYTTAYKYDTLTDTYTQLTDIPYNFYDGGNTVSIGTNIYLLGGSSKPVYKYDTLTNTYTKLTNIPYDFSHGSAASVGTDIYLFGSNTSYYTTAYKYDTLTDTYTKLKDIPYRFYYGSAVSVGTDVYLLGSSNDSNTKSAYKYDTTSDTYTQLTNIPYAFYSGSAVLVNQNIYLFGGYYNPTKVQVLSVLPKEYTNNSLVIANNTKINRYKTKLLITDITNGLNYNFNDFWYATTENDVTTFDTTTPKYYGNGTQWVQIGGTTNE